MNGDILPLFESLDDSVCELRNQFSGSGHPAVRDWKNFKLEFPGSRGSSFALEQQLRFFLRLQQRNHDIDSRLMPGLHFVFEPISTARPRQYA